MLVWDLLLFISLIDTDQKYNKCNIINRSHNINVSIKIIQPIKSSGRGEIQEGKAEKYYCLRKYNS